MCVHKSNYLLCEIFSSQTRLDTLNNSGYFSYTIWNIYSTIEYNGTIGNYKKEIVEEVKTGAKKNPYKYEYCYAKKPWKF